MAACGGKLILEAKPGVIVPAFGPAHKRKRRHDGRRFQIWLMLSIGQSANDHITLAV